jgi:hypothetical protein
MTERATELGGWCTTEHSPGGGTRVKAWLPIMIEDPTGHASPERRRNSLSGVSYSRWVLVSPPAYEEHPQSVVLAVLEAACDPPV